MSHAHTVTVDLPFDGAVQTTALGTIAAGVGARPQVTTAPEPQR